MQREQERESQYQCSLVGRKWSHNTCTLTGEKHVQPEPPGKTIGMKLYNHFPRKEFNFRKSPQP